MPTKHRRSAGPAHSHDNLSVEALAGPPPDSGFAWLGLAGLAFQGALPVRDRDVIGVVWSRVQTGQPAIFAARCTRHS